jgi:outer membrane receptor protein involved in Fe transport
MEFARVRSVFGRAALILLCAALFIGLSIPLFAQSTTDGAIAGTVMDETGAVIPNAVIVVRNNDTNAEQTVTSDATGYFRFNALRPAAYSVTIKVTGFAPYKADGVVVQIGSVAAMAPKMKVASATEKIVEVTGEAAVINTSSADFAPVLNQTAISNLPINGGRWSSFAVLTPGVTNNLSGFGLVSFRGMSPTLNTNSIDGANNMQAFFSEERGRTRAGYSSAKAAVQEFQVNTSNYTAEYGGAAGGVVNTVTKSGGNTLHGEVYFLDRDNAWGSMNPFTTITTQDSPGVFVSHPYKPKDWRKIWGLGVGGPIIKDKLFFFFAYDQFKRNFPGTGVASNPGRFFAQPTASDISTLATRVYGASNPATQAQATALYNNSLNELITTIGPAPRTGDQNLFFPKIDWQINQKNHLSLSVNRMRWHSPAGMQTQATNTYGISSFGNDFAKTTWGVAKLNSFFTVNLANEFRAQWGHEFQAQTPQTPTAYEQKYLMSPPSFAGYTNPLGAPPDVYITNGWDIGTYYGYPRWKYPDEYRTQFADTVSWARGKHMLKFGGDFNHVNDLSQNLFRGFGSYSYTSLVNYFSDVYKPNQCTATVSGKLLTGLPCYSNYQQGLGPLQFQFSTNDYAFFFQDDWRVLPRLTVNLGARYEYEQLPSPYSNLVNPEIPQTSSLPSDKNNIGPRVGVAWDVFGSGKTSLRAGYGMFYGRLINATIYQGLTMTGSPSGQVAYYFSQTQGGPSFPKVFTAAPTGATASKPAAAFFDPNFQMPRIHQYDVSLEQDLGWNTVLSLSYLGSTGRSLPSFVDTNLADSTGTATYTISDVNNAGPIPNGSKWTTPIYTSRPNSKYAAITDIVSAVNSNYNALAVQLNHRMSRHVQFNTNFTWAHSIDNNQSDTTGLGSPVAMYPGNYKFERATSDYNVPMRFVFHAVMEAPWNVKGWSSWLANGWQMAPMFQWQNGFPYSAGVSGSVSGGAASGLNGSGGRSGIDYLGRNTFRRPNTQIMDLKLSKIFKMRERYSLEFSGEGFNLFNHKNITGVSSTAYILSGTTLTYQSGFGVANSANSNFVFNTRQVQLGLRLKF